MKIKDDERMVRLSVRELVEFVLREGDIDNRRTGPAVQDAMLTGSQAHRAVQQDMDESYHAEVPLSCVRTFDDGISLSIDGRADGVIENYDGTNKKEGAFTIDEIKGVFRDVDEITEPVPVHLAQAEMYAYMTACDKALSEIHVQVTYIQLMIDEKKNMPVVRKDKIRRLRAHYTFAEIEEKYLLYTGLYEKWARFSVTHEEERKASASQFPFPYEYRPGQKKIVGQVFRTIQEKSRLFVQAPTGIGKTLAMLYPSVRAVGEGLISRIFYLTAKTVAANAAEEGMRIMRDAGLKFSYTKITAKEKLCPLTKAQCDPVHCERAKGHFSRVNEALYELLCQEASFSSETISAYAGRYRVCPYELTLDASLFSDVIIGDYNYAFAPHVMLKRYFASGETKDFCLLMDEAHNLPDRARDMYSAEIVKEDVLHLKPWFEQDKEVKKQLDKVNKQLLSLKRECEKARVFQEEDFPRALLYELTALKDLLTRFLDRHQDVEHSDEILTFYFSLSDFLADYEYLKESGYIAYVYYKDNGDFAVRLFCIDPSSRLKELLDRVSASVFFSATFLPVNYYKELLCGNKEETAIYVDSPFPEENRRILIARDVSSRYQRRNREEFRKIAGYLTEMAKGSQGNYLAFFPSHKYLEEVLDVLTALPEEEAPFDLISQKRSMREEERQAFLEEFDKKRERSLLALSVMGGVFSEGIDLTRDRLIGVAVVGTGLPQICTERELIRRYYDERQENGFDYAYRFPGFNKVMQAAGRLIRTPEDVGVILLMDERFCYRESLRLFPREWNDCRITDQDNVREEIERFWRYL